MKIKMNMCRMDRSLRVIFSLILMYIGFIETQIINNTLINALTGGFGILNLISALLGFCPIYFLAQISTLRKTDP